MLRMARSSEADAAAVAMSFVLVYDADQIFVEQFYDEWCIEALDTCFDVALTGPGSSSLQSGHILSILPELLVDWAGFACSEEKPCIGGECEDGFCYASKGVGTVAIVNLTDGTSVITDAYKDASGTVVGTSDFMEVRMILLENTTEEFPAEFRITKILANSGISDELDITFEDGTIFTTLND
mgnify:CR=1 FL=1